MAVQQTSADCESDLARDLCSPGSAGGPSGRATDTPHTSALGKKRIVLSIAAIAMLALMGARFGGEIFSHLLYKRHLAKLAALLHGPVARADQLKGQGRIYLVPLDNNKQLSLLNDFANRLQAQYALHVTVLPPMAVDASAADPGTLGSRSRYMAERLYEQVRKAHSELAQDPQAYLIGFTDGNLYSVKHRWAYSFTQRDGHVAVISTSGMEDGFLSRMEAGSKAAESHFQSRVWRILLKDVALLYWNLPLNNNPASLLHQPLDPDVPTEAVLQSDLNPAQTRWGQFEGEPCIFLSHSQTGGIKPIAGTLVRTCADKDLSEHDPSSEIFEIDLQLGLLIDKHTDFNLPDAIPIELERATRDGWRGNNAFGVSGTHNYDDFLTSKDNIQIDVIHNDGGREGLIKSPRWQPVLALAKYVDTDYSGKYYEMRWLGGPSQHYEMKRYDGEIKSFLPCLNSASLCYMNDYRDGLGRELQFVRDGQRRLVRLTSPNHSWTHLTYGPDSHVSSIEDSHGRTVQYAYDGRNQLTRVTYPSGEIYSYEYDSAQHPLTFSIAPNASSAPQVILHNEFANGRLSSQTLAGGLRFDYTYRLTRSGTIEGAKVHISDGRDIAISMHGSDSVIWERNTSKP